MGVPGRAAQAVREDVLEVQVAMSFQELEYAFFGCLLSYDGSDLALHLATALNLGAKAQWFKVDECRLLWAACEDRWRSGAAKLTPLDLIAAAQRISNDAKSDLHGIQIKADFITQAKRYIYTTDDIESYAKGLRDESLRREILAAVRESCAEMDGADARQIGSRLVGRVTDILQSGVATRLIPMTELTDGFLATFDMAYEQYVVKRNYDYVTGYALPWRHMSRQMNGISPGLTLIAARPSVGKSSFALQILEYLAEMGRKCVFNCLDMAASQISQRPASTLSGIPLNKLKRGMVNYPAVRPRLLEAKNTLDRWAAENRFTMMTEPDVDVFVSWCIMRRAQGLLDIVCIDYVQQLQVRGRFSSENERLTAISAKLKNLAVQYGIPVIALSQLSRDSVKGNGGERREPELSDLRGSGALEQDAFMVIVLHEDAATQKQWAAEPPVELVPDKDEDTVAALRPVWAIVKKNQNGEQARFPFIVYQDTFTWYLGDYRARKQVGIAPNMPKFMRISSDWRNSELEQALAMTNHVVPVGGGTSVQVQAPVPSAALSRADAEDSRGEMQTESCLLEDESEPIF